MKLRAVRALGEPFDGRFFERDPRFWPIARAARTFASAAGWPSPEDYGEAFGNGAVPVRFVTTPPRRKRAGPVDLDAMYDARIVRGEVPTRACNWHDFLNALVWASFPRAKAMLHRRQHALVKVWATPGATTLPNARTRAHDALALVDEGGVVVLRAGSVESTVPFGHALFEGLVLGARAMIARAVVIDVAALPAEDDERAALADVCLAARLEQPLVPEDLPRYRF